MRFARVEVIADVDKFLDDMKAGVVLEYNIRSAVSSLFAQIVHHLLNRVAAEWRDGCLVTSPTGGSFHCIVQSIPICPFLLGRGFKTSLPNALLYSSACVLLARLSVQVVSR